MRLAVDIGGTFTDLVYVDEDGNVSFYKLSSTPKAPEEGLLQGIKEMGVRFKEVVHATTVATNALLGQLNLELPPVALMTTKGFKDVIEIGRQNRPELYNPYFERPKPLVPRELRLEVEERVNAEGRILVPLNEKEAEELVKEASRVAVALAISFLHSYANPENEVKAKKIAEKYFRHVSVSSEVAPEPREYERTSTTVVNAALMPIVSRYLNALEGVMAKYNAKLYVMASSGGLVDSSEASKRPIQIIESGPAAGLVGVQAFSRELGIGNAISFDMGGTTAKAGTVINGEVNVTTEYEVGGRTHYGRIVKGSGYPVRFPFVDLVEVSAGGGTIIWRDEAGALRVGPTSAGADPGPMSYGKGGKSPTLTDANLVLGRIGERLLSGQMTLRKDLALRGLSALGDPEEVALNALRLAVLEMARAIRLVTVERGIDPSTMTLFAFGGAGPQFALEIAEELGIRQVLVPPQPGLFSAMGMLFADEKFEIRKSFPNDLERDFQELERELVKRLGEVDYFLRYADVRYEGQGWELTVQVNDVNKLREEFEKKHEVTYGFKLDRPIEVVTIRVFAVRRTKRPRMPDPPINSKPSVSSRKVMFDSWQEVPVYVRETLPMGFEIEGPAVIEEYSSTTILKPGWRARVEKMGAMRCWR
ncbi:MAG: N-methylhydantoinase A/acetone carboxylase subunit beta [Candidatus Aramenus sulfurataquae]|uniref:Hydantoinase/oxoprolinase family protein n=3 Tax=Candidatus Aramenus sulfurataquae TaxID=1326980 RepID=W7L856_9CREN|nr:MAG: N-methylhydantoinase A/acetone carboxylase subunit beta [Candidatus Aramenus sulfurataquae]MCL7344541.1 hydantoinase/oxoprolinase family protein [Candidatus Aramenus sulfurataquae]